MFTLVFYGIIFVVIIFLVFRRIGVKKTESFEERDN